MPVEPLAPELLLELVLLLLELVLAPPPPLDPLDDSPTGSVSV